jgi:hypothetical protein
MTRAFINNFAWITVLLLGGHCAFAQRPLTIVVQPSNGKLTFELNGQALSSNLLDALNKEFARTGSDGRVNVLFHSRTDFKQMFRVMATIGKVGFSNYHTYVFDDNRLVLTEFQLGKEEPFTLTP